GVYTVTVTAGTDNETVTLTPAVSGVTLSPAVVTVSNTTPDAGQSVFTAGPETIAADNTATSTLTLVVKDAQGNPLTGLKDSLRFAVKDSSGKVPAAGVITESAIAESGTKGTYTATLKGITADKYTIVPEYNGFAMGSLSATVTLTATAPDEKTSTIKTDAFTYVSGADMQVTVTLKDARGNAVTGASSLLTAETVTVQHATLKSGSRWKDNGDGTYTAAYRAITAGTELRAAVRLPGWSAAKQSEAYAITATAPDRAKSGIATDSGSYTSGEDMTVTVTLKDARGNAVTGAASSLTTDTVTVQNATLKSGSRWKDNGDGTYTAAYRAITAGTDLKAVVRLSEWSAAAESGAYIIYGTAALKDISVNGHRFRPDAGFPTTGFKGAEFTLNLESDNGGSTSASDYRWTADAPWVSVTDGVVRFTGKGTGNRVTITGTPKSNQGNVIRYSFALKSWFVHDYEHHRRRTWRGARSWCHNWYSGYRLALVSQLSGSGDFDGGTRGTLGGLWSEWGSLPDYSDARFTYDEYWALDLRSWKSHYFVNLDDGHTNSHGDITKLSVICRKDL
ncbi:invasin, partial [Kosakonia cowanii]